MVFHVDLRWEIYMQIDGDDHRQIIVYVWRAKRKTWYQTAVDPFAQARDAA